MLASPRYDVRCDGRGCAAKHLVLIPFANRDLRTSAQRALENLKHDPPAPGSWPEILVGGLAVVFQRKVLQRGALQGQHETWLSNWASMSSERLSAIPAVLFAISGLVLCSFQRCTDSEWTAAVWLHQGLYQSGKRQSDALAERLAR